MNSKRKFVPKDDFNEGSTEHHAEFVANHSSPEGEGARFDLGRQPSVSPVVQTELDNCVAQLTDELALKVLYMNMPRRQQGVQGRS